MKPIVLASLLAFTPFGWALDQTGAQHLHDLQQQWAHIQYQLPKDQGAGAFEKLANEAAVFVRQNPNTPEPLIWDGIINSSWAGATGGLSALGKVKAAKASLEKAIALDPQALQGSAYTSLAALYDRVPGWPIGFGDADKAEQLLKQALQLNPTGIDSLYFWGDHLYRQKRYGEARDALQKALLAAPRPGRETADAGRRKEIESLLADTTKKLS